MDLASIHDKTPLLESKQVKMINDIKKCAEFAIISKFNPKTFVLPARIEKSLIKSGVMSKQDIESGKVKLCGIKVVSDNGKKIK
jgi:hypothetical protein